MFIQMLVVDYCKGYGRPVWRFLCIDADFGKNPAGIESPQICCLLNFIILVQAFANPFDLWKISVYI